MTEEAEAPKEGSTEDLRASESKLLRAGAKLIGVITVSLIPAVIGWIDSSAKATQAVQASAVERVVGEKTYGKLVKRLNQHEQDLRKAMTELVILRELATNCSRPADDAAAMRVLPPVDEDGEDGEDGAEDVEAVEAANVETSSEKWSPRPKLSTKRPTYDDAEVQAAQKAILDEF